MIIVKTATLRRLVLSFVTLLLLAPSVQAASPRYLVYLQHFPPNGGVPANDAACPPGIDKGFTPGTYRAQVVFFPSDAQRATVTDGKTLGDRLPRPWGAVGIGWATEGAGGNIGWLSSMSPVGNEDKVTAEIKPPLISPLWTSQALKGPPSQLPALLDVIFRPLLPSSSSVDLLKLFCGQDTRANEGEAQLIRIHRILTLPTPNADDIAVVREFLLPGQPAADNESWGALLEKMPEKTSAAAPLGFLQADYLGDKLYGRHQALYERFAAEMRKKVPETKPAQTPGSQIAPAATAQPTPVSLDQKDRVLIDDANRVAWVVAYTQIALVLLWLGGLSWRYMFAGRPKDDTDSPPDALEARLIALENDLERKYSHLTHAMTAAIQAMTASRQAGELGSHNEIEQVRKLVEQWTAYVGQIGGRVIHFEQTCDGLARRVERLERELDEMSMWSADHTTAGDHPQLPPMREAPDSDNVRALPRPEVEAPGHFILAVRLLGYELPLGDAERQRLEQAPSWQEFGHRLVGEVLPIRASHQMLGKIDVQLGEISNQSLRLIIPELNTRPQSSESEKVAERPIERGVYGLITALVRPGLRIDGQVVRRAEVEVGA